MTKPTANEPTVLRGPNFRRHPERRELMIDAALEVFFNKGYDAARIEDVARLSGVGKSAVLYHFGSKLALLTDVVAKHCLPSSPLADGPAEHLIEAGLTDPAALPLLMIALSLFGLITMPLGNLWSRWREVKADDYAIKKTGKPQAFISAMTRLANQNLAAAEPPAWVEFLLHGHPSIGKRVAMARDFQGE